MDWYVFHRQNEGDFQEQFSRDGIQLFCGDSLFASQIVEPESVDLILTDPPYGVSKEGAKLSRGQGRFRGPDIKQDFGDWDRFETWHEFESFTTEWVLEVIDLLRPGGMFVSFFGYRHYGWLLELLETNDFKDKGVFIWCKKNPVPQLRKVGWMTGTELVLMAQKQGGPLCYNWEEGQQLNWMALPLVIGKKRLEHPTQKPEEIGDLFIRYWTKPGDLVLDPFAGTGTFLISAFKASRRAVGIELSTKFCELARNRLASVTPSFVLV